MPRFVNEICIRANMDEIFDFITTPSHWPTLWAPWSKRIEPLIERPLSPEDSSFVEYAQVFGLRHNFTWTCVAVKPPRFFLMEGVIQYLGKGAVFVQYDLEQGVAQVRYRRTVLFSHNSFFLDVIDASILKPCYFRISRKALQSTKRILEERAQGTSCLTSGGYGFIREVL